MSGRRYERMPLWGICGETYNPEYVSGSRDGGGVPSILHEAPLELLRRAPRLAAALLSGIPGVAIPEGGSAVLAPGEVTACLPVELRADAVVLLHGAAGQLAVVAEAQMSARALKRKRRVWPTYLTQARTQHDCPTVLMVFQP